MQAEERTADVDDETHNFLAGIRANGLRHFQGFGKAPENPARFSALM
jgi:hypothetical protein